LSFLAFILSIRNLVNFKFEIENKIRKFTQTKRDYSCLLDFIGVYQSH